MHPIKEDVDARLPLERATNVFWVQSGPAATIKLCDLSFSVSDVESLLLNIKTGIWPVDKVPSFVYGTCPFPACPYCPQCLFSILFDNGAWPNDWKCSRHMSCYTFYT